MPAKPKTENTKKAAGNAKKAEAAAQKNAASEAVKAKSEDKQWAKGAKDSSKQDAAADKAAEAQRKKAEKAALLAEEEKSLPSKPVKKAGGPAPKAKKVEERRGLDLGQLEGDTQSLNRRKEGDGGLSASNIDDALTALNLTQNASAGDKIDRHPERRFKAAYTQFEERRLEELKDEKGLRRQQKIDQIRKEFEKSPENPFNQGLVGRFDLSKEDAKEMREEKRKEVEGRLGASG
ncbi:MAG: hypothetical protein M1828_007619 [Chrysothrix sp. TS-e1954]|nr:MAG: hypothetical protein M1828_007619 [Chrysothrix sp. TS-e1954]